MINTNEEITNISRQKILCLEDTDCRNLEVEKIPLNWEDQSKFCLFFVLLQIFFVRGGSFWDVGVDLKE